MKWRLMAALMGVTLLVLLVQDIPLSGYLQRVEHERIITALERDAFTLAGRSEESLQTTRTADDSEITSAARRYRDAGGARVVIVNAAGIAIVTSDDDESAVGTGYASRPEIKTALTGQVSTGQRYSATLREELLYVTVPVFSGERVLGAVRLTYPDQVVTDAVTSQVRVLWIVGLTTVLLAGIVGLIVSNSLTRRLSRLKEATEHIAQGRLDVRADERSGAGELRSLSRSFNEMARRLHTLIEAQRAFAANASHQLRTPLTALRLRLEGARDLIETDPEGAATRLSAAETEADRLGDIIEGLLLLSRAEARSAPVETLDLAKIARERVAHWQPLAAESGVTLSYDGPESAPALAVNTAADQIIDNFVDNALTVSPAGSTILVSVEEDNAQRVLHVRDEGPGMAADDYGRAFDRFWSAQPSSRGSGLGLAIVAQLATASGATARLLPRPTGGLDAFVSFRTAHDQTRR